MTQFVRNASLAFSAGALGALANSLAVWFFGMAGIAGALGVGVAPGLTAKYLYPRIVWGGLWGFLLLIPLLEGSTILRGFILSLGPTVVQLLVVFPFKAGKGYLGLELGTLTPLLVVFYNAVWGIVAVQWYDATRKGS